MTDVTAAVLRGEATLSIESLDLAGPQRGEVLVDLHASGVCHTDYHAYAGENEVPMPIVLGHEGAGVVETVGDGVTGVAPGDHVVLSLLPSCGRCRYCASGRPYLCQPALDVRFSGTLPGGARRLHGEDGPINHFYAQSSFATATTVAAESVIPIREDVPLDTVAALGCGAATGIGAVFNTAAVEPGARVAVFGCGGTGTSALLAADAIGASEVVAVDVDPGKLAAAADHGATATVDATEADPVVAIADQGGVEYAFEFVGHAAEVRQQAIDAVDPGGTVVLSGAATDDASANLASVIGEGKTVVGNVAGSVRSRVDIPQYASMYASGDLDLDALVDTTYDLADADRALADLIDGRTIKPVLDCEE